jgi:hypothetical protein
MGGDIILTDKEQWALHFASILKSHGFKDAAKFLEGSYSPFPKEEPDNRSWTDVSDALWPKIQEFED